MTKQTFMKVWGFLLSSLTTGGKLKINYILGRNQLIIFFFFFLWFLSVTDVGNQHGEPNLVYGNAEEFG